MRTIASTYGPRRPNLGPPPAAAEDRNPEWGLQLWLTGGNLAAAAHGGRGSQRLRPDDRHGAGSCWRPPSAAAEDRNSINFANVNIEEGWRPPSTAAENCRPAGAGGGGGRRLRGGRAAAERGDLEGLRARPTPGDEGLPTLIYPRKRHIFSGHPRCGQRERDRWQDRAAARSTSAARSARALGDP